MKNIKPFLIQEGKYDLTDYGPNGGVMGVIDGSFEALVTGFRWRLGSPLSERDFAACATKELFVERALKEAYKWRKKNWPELYDSFESIEQLSKRLVEENFAFRPTRRDSLIGGFNTPRYYS